MLLYRIEKSEGDHKPSSRWIIKFMSARCIMCAVVIRTAETAAPLCGRLVPVQPHALDGHAPALVGPLPVLTLDGDEVGAVPSGLQDFLPNGDRIVDVAILRCRRVSNLVPAARGLRWGVNWQGRNAPGLGLRSALLHDDASPMVTFQSSPCFASLHRVVGGFLASRLRAFAAPFALLQEQTCTSVLHINVSRNSPVNAVPFAPDAGVRAVAR